MGYSVKLGKGGHGLEVYDSEGKYADEFSFPIGEQEIKGYDDFKTLYFSNLEQNSSGQFTVKMLEDLYNSNSDFKQQVDDALYDEYNNILTQAVNEYNAKQVWDTPEEAAKHLHELFVPNLVTNLLENNILKSDKSSVAGRYSVSTFAACLQMSRYKKNRGNAVSEQEFIDTLNNNKADGRLVSNTSVREFKSYIENAIKGGKCIPILRNINGVQYNDQQNVLESFYSENSPRNSCLAHYDAVNCSYLGSVIYFSTGDYAYGSGSLAVHGFVKMTPELKLLECPLTWHQGNENACNRGIPEVIRFRQAIADDKDFEKRIKEQLVNNSNGQMNESDADNVYRRFVRQINKDPGFCAILMGYDAIYGCSYHFDVLNLGICDILKGKE